MGCPCTAILVVSTVWLSVCMPHSIHDEEDNIKALETVRETLTEGHEAGATVLCVRRLLTWSWDWTTRMRISTFSVTSICTGCMDQSVEEATKTQSLMRKLRRFQLLKDFDCIVTITWTNNEDNREFAWWSRVRKKTARLHHGPEGRGISLKWGSGREITSCRPG